MPPRILALIAAFFIAIAPAAAHIGDDAPGLHVEVQRVDRQGASLQIVLRIENGAQDAVLLAGFGTDLGVVRVMDGPTQLASGAAAQVTLGLDVAGDMPGLFTLIVDFGPAGSGPVLIFTGA